MQIREASGDTERIKYSTNGIKTEISKNISLPQSKEKAQME